MAERLTVTQEVVGSNPAAPAFYTPLAQRIEHWPSKPRVEGSNPSGRTIFCQRGGIGRHKRLKISHPNRYAGSSPAAGTIRENMK